MRLVLHVAGATAEQLMGGLSAAKAVFERTGVDPMDGAAGVFDRRLWEHHGFDNAYRPDDELLDAARVMDKAEQAAVDACCAGWPEDVFRRRSLEVRFRETSLADQVREQVKRWVDTAHRSQLWRVIQQGGLEAQILLVDGWPQPTVDVGNGRGLLGDFGMLPATGFLELARQSGAPDTAAGPVALQLWLADPRGEIVTPWCHFDALITQRGDLFEAVADEWERGTGNNEEAAFRRMLGKP